MIKQLRQRGAHLVDIAHQLGCCERTARCHLAREAAPTGRSTKPRPSKLDHVWAAPRQDAEHTYEALVQAFRHFGGVPRTVLVDNQKAAVLKQDRDRRVIFTAGFLQLANHCGFAPKACRPQRPRGSRQPL